ncbi:MAG: NapC/NirT family cytochrome c [Parvularculaceae bacterium]
MTSDNNPRKAARKSSLSGFWSRIFPFAVPAAIGFGAAIILSGAMASFVQYSNTMEFCAYSCHEMESTVFEEFKESTHFSSRSGVYPVCADCHVPHGNWIETLIYKTGATKELFYHLYDVALTATHNAREKPSISMSTFEWNFR